MAMFSRSFLKAEAARRAALAALVGGGVLAAPPAVAEAAFENVMISDLRRVWISEGKPDPRMASESDTASFYHRRADGKILGAWLTTSCPERTGRGRLPYANAGGPDSGSDMCQRNFRSTFRWSSTVKRNGNRIVLDGRGELHEVCANGDCGETRANTVERATLLVEGGRCVVETYYREETSIRHGKTSVVNRVTKSPKTSCKAY